MTHILLIHAGPTPWDEEDRLVGNHPLPLTDEARTAIEQITQGLTYPISVVYRFKKNEAADQAAKIAAAPSKLRLHDSAYLDEVNLGLWQGLTRADLRFRFPSVFPQWEENPLAVNPPDGESLEEAVERVKEGLKRILRRNRGVAIALPLRPMAMQIALGVLRGEEAPAIATHLHNLSAVEKIEITTDDLQRFVSRFHYPRPQGGQDEPS